MLHRSLTPWAPSFLMFLARLTMTPIARLEGIRTPHTGTLYSTPGSHDRRESLTGFALWAGACNT